MTIAQARPGDADAKARASEANPEIPQELQPVVEQLPIL